MKQFENLEDAQTLALAIVDTIPEPFLVLDDSSLVMAASRSFYECFKVDAAQTRGRSLFTLGDGQWDIPALRHLIATIIPGQPAMEGFEVEHHFPAIGHKIMLLNARTVTYAGKDTANILLAFQDVTLRRQIEQEKAALNAQTEHLLAQQRILFQEMQHRVANSLQIIASILTLKAGSVTSEETRHHLEDARERVMSVAAVQTHLNASEGIDRIEVGAYLAKLGSGLSASMIGEGRPIVLDVVTDESIIASADAISLGLIVTELVINAIKYAFPTPRPDARILVHYEVQGSDWSLTVSDNGEGKTSDVPPSKGGLGTAIVKALAKQLDARISSTSTAAGLSVAITRATFVARLPYAA
ncbi:PAS domain-containing protein [Sphingobium sufflavum]|uniref:sensor histidine kinase n=1 Tax=Sphingobium sufflavum TaxID=1129547 RepID=UPI001F460DA7|nr:PAS domain-containing sensor histidine kinase [Sphingobium sufflavum]MCE7795366.1 PAS domain-containing protein [Sphingobium sufflavum]